MSNSKSIQEANNAPNTIKVEIKRVMNKPIESIIAFNNAMIRYQVI